jgi:calcineurin-like phosphoesterase family protein
VIKINTWITSDTHFGHNKDFIYESRGFKNIEEHDETLIRNWNSLVMPDDKIYHLGDLCLKPQETIPKILPRLNGHIILILGNHDTGHNYMDYVDKIYSILPLKGYEKTAKIVLSHIPIHPGSFERFENAINLHGHLHHECDLGKRYFNVNCEFHGLKPILLDKLC